MIHPSRARLPPLFLSLVFLAGQAAFAGDPDSSVEGVPQSPTIPVPLTLRMEASETDGFTADFGCAPGLLRITLRLVCEPETMPEALLGFGSPILAAGPARSRGFLRMLSDPGADGYVFSESRNGPLVVDMDSRSWGAALGESAGAWYLGTEVPSLGLWAGTPDDAGCILGGAAACSFLPAAGDFDAWFAEEPALPRRLGAAGMVWTGFGFPRGKVIAAFALSREEYGGRGWAVRSEAEYGGEGIRARGRVSAASPGWKGLGGEGADLWEARADISWLVLRTIRLEGRGRTGTDAGGAPDWEALVRGAWNAGPWGVEASLEGADEEAAPYYRVEPKVRGSYQGKAFCIEGGGGWVWYGPVLSRTDVQGALSIGAAGAFRAGIEGSYRWTEEGGFWKARLRARIPASCGEYSVQFGVRDWTPRASVPEWELSFALRGRVP